MSKKLALLGLVVIALGSPTLLFISSPLRSSTDSLRLGLESDVVRQGQTLTVVARGMKLPKKRYERGGIFFKNG